MKYLNKKNWSEISKGASLLSTGGGGDLLEAKQIFNTVFAKKKTVPIINLSDLASNDIVCTAYIAGSVASYERSTKPLVQAFMNLQRIIKKPIKGIVPVEIGPGDIAETVKIASIFNIPVVDADFVGMRSSPEVYLETITLAKLSRTPLVLSNKNGKIIILRGNLSAMEIEKSIRKFAQKSKGAAYVVGYPFSVGKIKKVIGEKTLTLCQKIGVDIKKRAYFSNISKANRGKIIFEGVITSIKTRDGQDFLRGYVYLKGTGQFINRKAKIYLKNESLIFWVDNKIVLTCPDSICTIDRKTRLGIYNRDMKLNQKVIVLGIPALPIWRSKKGQKLFGPKTFGFNFSPTLLNLKFKSTKGKYEKN